MFRILGTIFIGVCLSGFVIVLMTIFLSLRNLPEILASLRRFLRGALRGSYRLYSAFLSPIRSWIYQHTGYDIFHPVARTICTVVLSVGIGVGLLVLFSLGVPTWVLIVLALHGLFVGLAWESILRSDDFQMGVNLE
jgi:hypothetical protein